MGEGDVRALHDGVLKLEKKSDKLEAKLDTAIAAISDLRVLMAGNYPTKAEFAEYQKIEEARVVAIHKKIDTNKDGAADDLKKHIAEEKSYRYKLAGVVFVAAAFAFSVFQWVFDKLVKLKG